MSPLIILLLLLLGLVSGLPGVNRPENCAVSGHKPPDWHMTGSLGLVSGSGFSGLFSGLFNGPIGLTGSISRGPWPFLGLEDPFWLSDVSNHSLVNSECSCDLNGLFCLPDSSPGLPSTLEWVSMSSLDQSSSGTVNLDLILPCQGISLPNWHLISLPNWHLISLPNWHLISMPDWHLISMPDWHLIFDLEP